MPNYTQANLNSAVANMVSGTYTDAVFLERANAAVRDVALDVDLRSTKRKTALSPNLFKEFFQYTCPTDFKMQKLIDLKPQKDRGRFDYWRLTTEEEFDRLKEDNRVDKFGDPIEINTSQWLGENLIAISDDDFVRKLLVSRPINDTSVVIDPLTSVGDWEGFGDGENLTRDATYSIKGSASINWDINTDGGTTAGIVNSSLDTFDISSYSSLGSVFVWVYITSSTNVTNFILRIGSSSSNYYYITITTNNEGVSFYNGLNLLRFDFINKTETGTVDEDGCTYAAIYMTKAAGKISETDYRFENLVMKIGDHYDLIYYSKYLWQSSVGVYLENATATTDYVNADTEEVGLILERIAEYIEQSLTNYGEADRHHKNYLEKLGRYKFEYPSEVKMQTQKYWNL